MPCTGLPKMKSSRFCLKADFAPCCIKEINVNAYSKGNKRQNKNKEKYIFTCLRQ